VKAKKTPIALPAKGVDIPWQSSLSLLSNRWLDPLVSLSGLPFKGRIFTLFKLR